MDTTLNTIASPAAAHEAHRSPRHSQPEQEVELTPPIRTDQESYTLYSDGETAATIIRYRYRNPLPDTLFVQHCGQFVLSLEQKVDGNWRPFWAPVIFDCGTGRELLPPGAELRDSVFVFGAWPQEKEPALSPTFATRDLSGPFRLVWQDIYILPSDTDRAAGPADVWDRGIPIPTAYRSSNRFWLVLRD